MKLDAGEFTLWEANPISNEDLVIVIEEGKETEEFCPRRRGGSSCCSRCSKKKSLSAESIAGVVLGTLAGTGFLARLAVCIW